GAERGAGEEGERYPHPPGSCAPGPAALPEAPRRAPSPPSIPDEDESESIFDRPFPAEPQPMPMGEAARREAGERRSLFDWIRRDRAKAAEPAARAEKSRRGGGFPPPPPFERAPQRGAERARLATPRFVPPPH